MTVLLGAWIRGGNNTLGRQLARSRFLSGLAFHLRPQKIEITVHNTIAMTTAASSWPRFIAGLASAVVTGSGVAALHTVSCQGTKAEDDFSKYMSVLNALQKRLENLDTKTSQPRSPPPSAMGGPTAGPRDNAPAQFRNGRRLLDRDELARSLGSTKVGATTFWRITDLYQDTRLFEYCVEEVLINPD
jgi:hypothetical protein